MKVEQKLSGKNASLGEKRRCFLGGFSNFRWPLFEAHIELIKKHMALVDETPHMGMLYGLHLSEMIQRNQAHSDKN